MNISLIIAVYKKLDFLSLVFQSLELQSFKKFEVIIAEDDNQSDTVAFLDKARKKHSFLIKHVSQEDNGFRKNKILNEAIRHSDSEKLVFIDGDCLLHRHFLRNYDKGIKQGLVRAGRRLELSKKHTESMLDKDKVFGLDIISLLLRNSKYPEKAIYLPNIESLNSGFKHLLGCNWGIMKNDLLAINGFDEDYVLSGVGEDSDIEWRLIESQFRIESIIHSCLQYHLYHPVHYNQEILDKNLEMLEIKKGNAKVFCINGINIE